MPGNMKHGSSSLTFMKDSTSGTVTTRKRYRTPNSERKRQNSVSVLERNRGMHQ